MTQNRTIWTIGYEKAAFVPFVATLREASVKRVIDVRDLPLSRRPGFSKRSLQAGLAEAGIGYVHLRPLGTPPAGREANKHRQWPLFWQIVEKSLATPEAHHALEQAASLAADSPSCLLCYEADPCICHRLRVAGRLESNHDFKTLHLTVSCS